VNLTSKALGSVVVLGMALGSASDARADLAAFSVKGYRPGMLMHDIYGDKDYTVFQQGDDDHATVFAHKSNLFFLMIFDDRCNSPASMWSVYLGIKEADLDDYLRLEQTISEKLERRPTKRSSDKSEKWTSWTINGVGIGLTYKPNSETTPIGFPYAPKLTVTYEDTGLHERETNCRKKKQKAAADL